MDNLSNRAFLWLIGGLITTILLLAMLIQHAAAWVWVERGVIGMVVLGMLWLLYLVYHHFQMKRLERMQMLAQVSVVETEQWRSEEEFNHQRELELRTLAIEEQRILLDREKLRAEIELNRWRVLVPAGHTVVFPAEDYHSIASHAPARIAAPGKGEIVDAEPKPVQVPGPYDLVDIFRNMEIAKDHIFLGKHEEGSLTVNAHNDLCHGVFNAATGQGKTIIERGIEMQLLKAGCEVIHADIKFTLIDEKGLDYRPIAKVLLDQGPITGIELPHLLMVPEQIRTMIEWAAVAEVPRRLELYHAGIHNYKTLYIFLEEFLYLVKLYPEIAEWVECLIIVGRSLGIKLFTVAQNFLARDTKLSGAMRENFQTAYYIGGDDHSGAVILDVSKKELMQFLSTNNIQLGQGLTMLRNNTVAPQARLIRTGWASNEALYYLFGRADNFRIPGSTVVRKDTGPLTDSQRGLRLDERGSEQHFFTRSQSSLEEKNELAEETDSEESYAQENGLDCLPETTQGAQENVRYLLNNLQVEIFCVAYEVTSNIDESLRKAGAHTGYRAHARQIIAERGLRKGQS